MSSIGKILLVGVKITVGATALFLISTYASSLISSESYIECLKNTSLSCVIFLPSSFVLSMLGYLLYVCCKRREVPSPHTSVSNGQPIGQSIGLDEKELPTLTNTSHTDRSHTTKPSAKSESEIGQETGDDLESSRSQPWLESNPKSHFIKRNVSFANGKSVCVFEKYNDTSVFGCNLHPAGRGEVSIKGREIEYSLKDFADRGGHTLLIESHSFYPILTEIYSDNKKINYIVRAIGLVSYERMSTVDMHLLIRSMVVNDPLFHPNEIFFNLNLGIVLARSTQGKYFIGSKGRSMVQVSKDMPIGMINNMLSRLINDQNDLEFTFSESIPSSIDPHPKEVFFTINGLRLEHSTVSLRELRLSSLVTVNNMISSSVHTVRKQAYDTALLMQNEELYAIVGTSISEKDFQITGIGTFSGPPGVFYPSKQNKYKTEFSLVAQYFLDEAFVLDIPSGTK